MSAPLNVRATKAEYDRWLKYLRDQGFQVHEERKGSMMDSIQVHVMNSTGEINPAYGAMSFMDAQAGRRVYAIQLRAISPEGMPAVMAHMATAQSCPLHA